LTFLRPYQPVHPIIPEKSISHNNIAELIHYEEYESNSTEISNLHRRSSRMMHNYVPLNPFKATIRMTKGLGENSQSIVRTDEEDETDEIFHLSAADSPASFPSTPFSRAYVMNRAAERVVSVLFAARDKLRLEAQSVSRDEYSRMVAKETQTSGQFAIFDPRQTSNGIALTCGNHCAVKIGKGLVCSCRSMVAVRPNAYVYFEFSITVSSNQSPQLAIGLSPPDCPLNVMIGSWPGSIGLSNDGQLMISSRSFMNDPIESIPIIAGTTVGILIYSSSASLTLENDHIHEFNLNQTPLLFRSSEPELTQPTIEDMNSSDQIQDQLTDQSFSPGNDLIQFNINGNPISCSLDAKLVIREVLAQNTPLYPTVSLFTEDTRVWCRFCEADVVYRDRKSINAPPGVRVYCLDGSLLLRESD
jgi:hypothetical protein